MRFTIQGGRLAISAVVFGAVMSWVYLKKLLWENREGVRSDWEHFADPSDVRKKWIYVDALPANVVEALEDIHGPLGSAYWQERLPEEVTSLVLPEDAGFFIEQQMFEMRQAEELARACGWLRLVSQPGWYDGRWAKKIDAFSAATEVVKSEALYGFKISNWRTLDRKANEWLEQGRQCLVSKKFGNRNALKCAASAELVTKRLVDLYASHTKPTFETVATIYNKEAAKRGWPQYTAERIRQILVEPAVMQMWVAARHGVTAARGLTEHSLRRRRPAHPDAMWSIDGTTVQLYSGDTGALVKAWYLVTVTDVFSDCVIGWALGSSETSTLVLRAVRRAVAKMGFGPAFAQFDGSMANLSHEVTGVIERLQSIGIKSQPYNGKAKYVERIQGWMEQHFMRFMPNFVGGNITARSLRTRANPDWLKAALKAGNIPGADQVPAQVELCIEAYNNTAIKSRGATPIDLYRIPDERRRVVPRLLQVSVFWVKRAKMVRYTQEGLAIEIEGQRHWYEVQSAPGVEDYQFRQNYLGDRFWVRYDPDSRDEVNLYDADDKWVATASLKHEFGATPKEWEDGEGARLREALAQRKRYIEESLAARLGIREEMDALGAEEMSFELVHKDALNRLEEDTVTRLLNESGLEPAFVPAPPKRKPLYYNEDIADSLLDD